MYLKPCLERFGTFRDLTKVGFDTDGDGGFEIGRFTVPGTDGCNLGGCSSS